MNQEYDEEATKGVLNDILEKVKKNPYLHSAMTSFISSYKKIRTLTGLENALATFGKYGVKCGRKKIPISVTAIARRIRKNTLGTGPFPSRLRKGEHSFAQVQNSALMPRRKRAKLSSTSFSAY